MSKELSLQRPLNHSCYESISGRFFSPFHGSCNFRSVLYLRSEKKLRLNLASLRLAFGNGTPSAFGLGDASAYWTLQQDIGDSNMIYHSLYVRAGIVVERVFMLTHMSMQISIHMFVSYSLESQLTL